MRYRPRRTTKTLTTNFEGKRFGDVVMREHETVCDSGKTICFVEFETRDDASMPRGSSTLEQKRKGGV
jgi:hypothetical protein